eukprot:767614-Hanusia_phi.AAC.10
MFFPGVDEGSMGRVEGGLGRRMASHVMEETGIKEFSLDDADRVSLECYGAFWGIGGMVLMTV